MPRKTSTLGFDGPNFSARPSLIKPMTHKDALRGFREVYLPEIRKLERQNAGDTPRRSYVDEAMRREAWSDYVDSLQKDGQITRHQAHTWNNPF